MGESLSRQREPQGKMSWGGKELGKAVREGGAFGVWEAGGLHHAEPCRLEGIRSHRKVLQRGKNRDFKIRGGPPSPYLFDLIASLPSPSHNDILAFLQTGPLQATHPLNPLYWLFLLPRTLFPQISTWLAPSLVSLCSNDTLSMRPSSPSHLKLQLLSTKLTTSLLCFISRVLTIF